MREKFRRFMTGRYGVDQLSRAYLMIVLVLLVIALFFRRAVPVLDLVALLLLGYTYYRIFSRDISKMYAQNQKYLNFRYKLTVRWNNAKKRFAQRISLFPLSEMPSAGACAAGQGKDLYHLSEVQGRIH